MLFYSGKILALQKHSMLLQVSKLVFFKEFHSRVREQVIIIVSQSNRNRNKANTVTAIEKRIGKC
jgi:hypothetical protein